MDLFGHPDPDMLPDPDDAYESDVDTLDIDSQADTAAGLLPPRRMALSLGQDLAQARLLQMLHDKRLPHALIFAGPEGVGKATMAYRFARHILKGDFDTDTLDMDPMDPVFRRVASGGHPDLLTRESATEDQPKGQLDAESVRKIPGFLRMTSSDDGWRVAIIDDADTMQRTAQNALLKILEEPPRHAVLILIAHRIGALLPTIRSRCQVVRFQSLDNGTMQDLLRRGGVPGPYDHVLAMADGSIGQALRAHHDGAGEIISASLAVLDSAPDIDWVAAHHLAEDLARKGNERKYDAFASFVTWVTMRYLRLQAQPQTGPEFPGQRPLGRLFGHSSLAAAAEICEKLQEHFRKTEMGHLDRRHGVLGAIGILTSINKN